MAFFEYQGQHLGCEGVALTDIARQVGTPFYCYSRAAIEFNYQRYAEYFTPPASMICYAVKANSNQAVLGIMAGLGAGADVVSEGELRRALAAGIPAQRIVFSGVAKTAQEMQFALAQDIFQFNVESEPELLVLNEVALRMNRQAKIAFRINPDIDAKTHAKISTGKFINKFGLSWKRIREICATASKLPGIKVQGVAMHIGSQLTELQPYEQAFRRLAELAGDLKNDGHDISVLDIGGGLGIAYDKAAPPPPTPAEYASLAFSILGHLGCKIVIEPGRSLVGTAGILVSRVVYVKQGETDRFLIIDAGMNDFLRPSLYDARHAMIPECRGREEKVKYQVVGPVCETGDTFATNYELPRFEPDDLIAILDTGAYGAAMSFTYNTRPLPPEVLVSGDRFTVVRKRQSYDELIGMDQPVSDAPGQDPG